MQYTQEELNRILDQHALWLDTVGKVGKRANLSGANLSGANLSKANLSEANLEGANLSEADLSFTHIKSFALGQHYGYAWLSKNGVMVTIGCEEHSLKHWLKEYKNIGKKAEYTPQQIKEYGMQLKLLAKCKF